MRKLILCAIVALGLAPNAAFASLLVEPGLAYRTGTYDGGTAASKGKVSGVGLSARVAYEFPIVFVGLDLGYSFGTSSPDTGTGADVTAVSAGPVVGASLPMIPLRFWAAYLLWDYSTMKAGGAVTYDNVYTGSAIKIGGGYTIIPMVSVNLEYVTHTFTKFEDKVSNMSGDLSPNVNGTDFVLSVSIPLSL